VKPLRLLGGFAAAYSLVLLALTVVHLIAPQRNGIIALSQVAAPHMFLGLGAALVVAGVARQGRSMLVVTLAVVVGVARFGPGMVSLPPASPSTARTIDVVAWNLAASDLAGERLVDRLLESDAELVSLEELGDGHAAALEASPRLVERFPHRVLRPDRTVLGMGLLSTHPLHLRGEGTDPPHLLADMNVGPDLVVGVLAAHPLPPIFARVLGSLPISYEATERDQDLRALRALVQPDLDSGRPVVVLGDLNVTDREPGYWDIAGGLLDAHAEVGVGPGSTWRPGRLAGLPFGVLRIDYVLTGNSARPLSIATDCTPDGGDHCLLSARIGVSR
jgi:vancomycin resistance protein VanJ